MKHPCVIPFDGFYNTLHDDAVDQGLEQMFSDRDTGNTVNHDLVAHAWDKMNWKQVHIDYTREYCENFAHEFKLDLTFDELVCPREYNFVTDRCFAFISTESLRKVFAEVNTPDLRNKVRENHSSYDGFHSFYSNDLDDWPSDVTQWDCNEIGTLLQTYADQESTGDFDSYEQYNLMDSSFSNGFLDDILYKNCANMGRLLEIHTYLDARAKREEVAAC